MSTVFPMPLRRSRNLRLVVKPLDGRGGPRAATHCAGIPLALVAALSVACYRVPPSASVAPDARVAAAERAVRQAIICESSIRVDTVSVRALGVFPFSIVASGKDTSGLLSDAVGFGLADLLRADLAKSHQLEIVDRLRLDALLREQQFATSGRVDPATAPRAGRLIGARRVLTGQLLADREQLTLATRLTDVAAPNTPQSLSGTAGLDAIFDAEKEVARQIFNQLGITLTPAEAASLEQRPTKNIGAFIAYSRGVQLETLGRYREAARQYQNAALIDPGFTGATVHAQEAQQFSEPGVTQAGTQGASATNGSVIRAGGGTVDRLNGIPVSPAGAPQTAGTVADPAFPNHLITIVITIRPPN